ncbi:hypothetical protein Tco_0737559 [Tanacetum coccineum]
MWNLSLIPTAPNTSSNTRKNDSKGKKPGAKSRYRKQLTYSKHHPLSKIEATKGGSSKAPTGSKTSHLVKETQSSSSLDTNPSQPPASTHVVAGLHKEDHQATGGPKSLGVTSEGGANPQLSSGMLASIPNKHIYLVSTIIHSESTSEHDVSAKFKAGANSGLSTPKDSISPTIGKDKGPNKLSLDHIFAGTDPHVLVEKFKSTSKGLEIILTQPTIEKGASDIAKKIEEEFNTFPDLSSSDDAKQEIKLKDISKQVQNVEANFMDLDSPKDDPSIVVNESEEEGEAEEIHATKHTETEDTSVPQPPSPINSLPNKLKDLPSKFNDLTEEVKGLKKHVHGLEIKLLRYLKEIPNKLETFTSTVSSLTSYVAELKNLQWELTVEFLALPSQVSSVQAKLKTLDALLIPQEALLKLRGSLSRKTKARQTMSSKDDEEEETESDSENDYANPVNSMVESSKKKKLKKFDFVTEGGKHVYFTAEKIEEQKRIEESLKAELAKQEVKKVKNDLVDLMGSDVVTKYYKNKLLYNKYCDKMLKRRKISETTNCDVLTRRGPITPKVYREDGTTEVIPNFKTSDLHLVEWREIDFNKPLEEQDPLDELNDPANKKRKRADDFHDFRSTKKFKSSV